MRHRRATGGQASAQNGSHTVPHTYAWIQPLLVPPRSIVTAHVTLARSTLAVPYSIADEFVYDSGAKTAVLLPGVYAGLSSHDLQCVSVTHSNLDGSPAARAVQQSPAIPDMR